MRKYLSLISHPFKYDGVLWGILAIMLAYIAFFDNASLATTIASVAIAVICAVLVTHIKPGTSKGITQIIYVTTVILLLCTIALPSETAINPWMRMGFLSPTWFVGLTCTLVVAMLYTHNEMPKRCKTVCLCVAPGVVLGLLALQNLIQAILIGTAICIALYICGIARSKVRLVIGALFVELVLCISIIMLVGKTDPELANSQEERSGILHRIDSFKQRMISYADNTVESSPLPHSASESNSIINRSYRNAYDANSSLIYLPVLLMGFVVVQATRKLKDCKLQYTRLLGIGTACVLLADTINDVAMIPLGEQGSSSLFIDSAMFGVILCCIGRSKHISLQEEQIN